MPHPTNTILDSFEPQQPKWWHLRRRISPTALQLASAELEFCRKDQLHHKGLQEYHAAMAAMLAKREQRLQQDIERLNPKITEASE